MRRNPITWRQVAPTQRANTTLALHELSKASKGLFTSLKDVYDQERAVNTANMLNDLLSGKELRNIPNGNYDSNVINQANLALEKRRLDEEVQKANIDKARADTEYKLAQALQQQTQNEYLPQNLQDIEDINRTKVSMAEFNDANKQTVLDSVLAKEASQTRLNNYKSNPFNILASTKTPASVINADNKASSMLTEELAKSYRNREIPINVKMSNEERIKYGIDKGIIEKEDEFFSTRRKFINDKYDEMIEEDETIKPRNLGGYGIRDIPSEIKVATINEKRKEELEKYKNNPSKVYEEYLRQRLTDKQIKEVDGNLVESDEYEIPMYKQATRKLTDAEILEKVNPNGLYEMIGALTGINANKDEEIKDKVKKLTNRLEDIKDSTKRMNNRKKLLEQLNALTDDNNEVSKQKIIDLLDNFEQSMLK